VISRWWYGPHAGGQVWEKDRGVTSFDGTSIRYTLRGPAGAPVVAQCAGFDCPDTYWTYLVPALEDDYRVLVWNYRGIGVSGLPRDPGFHARAVSDNEMTIEANARDLEAILDAEGVAEASLVGHSMGCQVVLEAYRRRPASYPALVMLAGPYRSPLRTFYGTDLSARVAPLVLPFVHLLPRTTLVAWRLLLSGPLSYPVGVHVLHAIGPRAKPEDMKGYFEHVSTLDPLIVAKMVRGMHDHDASDLLGKIDVPVLILHGTSDPFTPMLVAEVMEREIADAKLVKFQDASHTLPIEYPDEVASEIRSFFERSGIAGGGLSRS
jgi:pimeloyl-ACP methyl ester carboxylesterase